MRVSLHVRQAIVYALLAGVACMGFGLSQPAQASDLSLMPLSLHLDRERDRATVHIINNGSEPAVVQADAIAWTREGGVDRDASTDALVVSPPVFTLQPGQTQVVRIGLRRASAASQETTFRVLLRELPSVDGLRVGSGSKAVLRVPVYVAPARVQQDARLQAHIDSEGQVVANISNHGNVHLKVGMLRLRDGQPVALAEERSGAVLFPGEERSYRLQPRGGAAGGALRLEVVTDQGVHDVPLLTASR